MTRRAHEWRDNSGTTEACEACGCVAYFERNGVPSKRDYTDIRYARWVGGRWVGWTTKDAREPPECVPERGGPAHED
jgi:hypothetical protein